MLVTVVLDYEYAVRHLSALDDQPMVHREMHAETGGWGVHWRLDDVLRVVFPNEHDYEIWPKPSYYKYSQAESMPVELLPDIPEQRKYQESPLRALQTSLETKPATRKELEYEFGEVWDENEFMMQFENLGYRPPFVIVRHLISGERGTVLFQNQPRFYFRFDRNLVI